MAETKRSVEQLAADYKALSPGDRLRVAAGCSDQGRYDLAESLAEGVVMELQALRLLKPKAAAGSRR